MQASISAIILSLVALASVAHANFSTVINVPPSAAPNQIGSNTQLNVTSGGTLPEFFTAGATNNSGTNIEVNFGAGATGGTITAYQGSTLNVTGGTLDGIITNWLSVANVSGGSVGGVLAETNTTINLTGGSIGDGSFLRTGSTTNITGGSLGGHVTAESSSNIIFSGGSIGDHFENNNGFSYPGQLHIVGGEFRVDGVLVPGLDNIGNSTTMPFGGTLSGTLADGRPFTFSAYDSDNLSSYGVTLVRASLPAIGPPMILASTDPVPLGIRTGQTLIANTGSVIGDNFYAGRASTVRVEPGSQVGSNLEATEADVTITGGTIGEGFDSFGSTVHISGATFGNTVDFVGGTQLDISAGQFGKWVTVSNSSARITGGSFGDVFGVWNTPITITGGSFGDYFAATNSTANISGGTYGNQFEAGNLSQVNISGGTFGDKFQADAGSTVNLFVRSVTLDGFPISGVTLGNPYTITSRFSTLRGVLADGSSFEFYLSANQSQGTDFFSLNSKLTVTLVPEPSTQVMLLIATAAFRGRHRLRSPSVNKTAAELC